ncbi:hypothetical protein AAFF_G00098830 [Aldrovandia affinis]|uniref:Uncharacterized protein n=1 Tax=Aldrovandia affinis TaxID=143900 RepID=A0AAD7RVI0_9TELE|nr:hypothetical protein AAFF_G00098830 [Aldrovandia affinis]
MTHYAALLSRQLGLLRKGYRTLQRTDQPCSPATSLPPRHVTPLTYGGVQLCQLACAELEKQRPRSADIVLPLQGSEAKPGGWLWEFKQGPGLRSAFSPCDETCSDGGASKVWRYIIHPRCSFRGAIPRGNPSYTKCGIPRFEPNGPA